jgi:hypothetical protein
MAQGEVMGEVTAERLKEFAIACKSARHIFEKLGHAPSPWEFLYATEELIDEVNRLNGEIKRSIEYDKEKIMQAKDGDLIGGVGGRYTVSAYHEVRWLLQKLGLWAKLCDCIASAPEDNVSAFYADWEARMDSLLAENKRLLAENAALLKAPDGKMVGLAPQAETQGNPNIFFTKNATERFGPLVAQKAAMTNHVCANCLKIVNDVCQIHDKVNCCKACTLSLLQAPDALRTLRIKQMYEDATTPVEDKGERTVKWNKEQSRYLLDKLMAAQEKKLQCPKCQGKGTRFSDFQNRDVECECRK